MSETDIARERTLIKCRAEWYDTIAKVPAVKEAWDNYQAAANAILGRPELNKVSLNEGLTARKALRETNPEIAKLWEKYVILLNIAGISK